MTRECFGSGFLRLGRYNFGYMKPPVTDSVAKTFLLSGNEIMLRYANSALGHLTW